MLTSMALMESVLMQQDISTGEVVGQSLVVPCCTLRSFAASIFVKSQPHTTHTPQILRSEAGEALRHVDSDRG